MLSLTYATAAAAAVAELYYPIGLDCLSGILDNGHHV
jgi:hypothetical protein